MLRPGDEVLVSIMEHHSNLLVWQQAAKRTGATLRYLDCTQDGKITAEMVEAAVTDKTKIFAVTQISNVLGWKNDIKSFAEICHRKGCLHRAFLILRSMSKHLMLIFWHFPVIR